ncbi:hypothetical protein [Thiolapillus sp.]
MSYRKLWMVLLFFLTASVGAREYVVSHAVPEEVQGGAIGKVTVSLYATAEGGEVLEVHQLPAGQWQLKSDGEEPGQLRAFVDSRLPLPLWAEVRLDGEPLADRAELNAPGDLTAGGEIYSKSGFRFPDNSVQTTAANTVALDKVLGGSSRCPAGSSIRAIDASGNVTCENDDVGSAGVTQVNTGAGLTGGPITTTGTISIANNGVTGSMIQDGTIASVDIQNGSILAEDVDTSQIQRRVSGTCPTGYLMTGINADGSLQCTGVYVLVPHRFDTVAVDSGGMVGDYTSLALDASGYPVISYYDGTNLDLKLAHCNDAYCTGGDESIVTVDSDDWVGRHTSLALDASGYPVISYADVANGDLKLAHCNDANCEGGDDSIVTVDSSGTRYTSLVLDAGGHPVISYNAGNFDLKLAHCFNSDCSSRSLVTVDSGGSVGLFTSLALDASGHPVISYYDSTNGDLKLAHCNDANCAGDDESLVTVDSSGTVGAYTSLALDASGYPVISYYDSTNGDLKLAHCNDANCEGGDESLVTVDSDGNVGTFTSLALDASGNPVISYIDFTNYDLKLVHCNDNFCTGGDELIVTLDSGYVREYTSLALDASGNPVISYPDYANNSLNLAR